MNEFSFVTFGAVDDGCNLQLPINQISDLCFFIPETLGGDALVGIDIVDIEGDLIRACSYDFADGWVKLKTTSITDLGCFRLAFKYTGNDDVLSNIFRYTSDTTKSTLIKYLCYEPQFGFDYSITGSYNQVRLPILLPYVNYPQEDKIYTDANGVRRVLFSKIDTECDLETEYLDNDTHKKIVVMLGHDEVYFDSVRMQKSGAYEIDNANEDLLPCGKKLHKATAKVRYNTTLRNNNC